MAKYGQPAGLPQGLGTSIKNAIAAGVQQGLRTDKAGAMNPGEARKQEYYSGLKKEAALSRALID